MPPDKKLFLLGKVPVRSIKKDKPHKWSLPENHQTSQIMAILLEQNFEGAPSLFYSPMATSLLILILFVCPQFSRLQWSWRVKKGIDKLKHDQAFCSY